jgi:NADPH2:quinone reductase
VKALVYEKAHTLGQFAIELRDIPPPTLREADVLVEIRAIGVNPGEAFIRGTRSAEPSGRVLLGWEFAGEVAAVGPAAQGFEIGDRVFGAGDVSRDGAWAQQLAIDHRLVAKIPDTLAFAEAASLPIGALTAWESLFREDGAPPAGVRRVLIVGGAGGVGSMATQILKAKTDAFVITTASRPDSSAWSQSMGADLVIDHTQDVAAQLAKAGIDNVDFVFSTASTAAHIPWIGQVLRPFGLLAFVDGSPSLNVGPLMSKSVSIHLKMVFSRVLFGLAPERHGQILQAVAQLVELGRVRPIVTTRLEGLTAEAMKAAHRQLETHRTIGKVVNVV